MSRASRRTALETLRAARKRLEESATNPNPEPWVANKEYEDANDAVTKAEKAVFLGSQRGWKY